MSERSWSEWCDRLPGRRVLVLGDIMLDEYLWGEATRISPEAPVPVVEVRRRSVAPGGAANAAANIASLGGTAILGGVVGADDAGQRLVEALRSQGVAAQGVTVDAARPTTVKARLIAGNQQIVRMDHEARIPVGERAEETLWLWAEREMPAAQSCVLSDYGKGVVSEPLARRFIDLARQQGIPVVVDPKGTDYAKYRGAAVIKPNIGELECVLQEKLPGLGDLERAGRRLAGLLPGTAVLITRGPDGMALFQGEAAAWYVPSAARQVYDVTGAGDIVVSTLALALAAGAPLEAAIRLSNHAAGLAVACRGTVVVALAALKESLGELSDAAAPG
jgi:D-beta-D-heptose 7-phosphate kinase/D-beta-D-heptose 1-phosphate adenosyltransferase